MQYSLMKCSVILSLSPPNIVMLPVPLCLPIMYSIRVFFN
uniref:Uncharacterized protein n=1 Tax=Anguilla anguilla TaxID=7936 RepID=A0A0E9SBN4_ANGAN